MPLDEAALRETLRGLKAQNIESLAVCLLFSFLHPEHEARVREIAREEMPGCNISLSCEILPQIREYYRLSTTVINAYLQPILARYIANLDRRLTGAGVATRQKYIMQSNGGMSTFPAAARTAVTTVLSGPAGGVTAGAHACRHDRLAQHHHLRHGRHLLRRRADQGRRADRLQPRQDRRPRHRRADDGHQHGERRRRHHRQGRPLRRARSRPAERRRGAGAGLLRPRRRGARPSPTAISCSAISAPTISSAAA